MAEHCIHPTAAVSPNAQLGDGVVVGPFVVIEDDVRIGDGCQISASAVIKAGTTLGRDNQIGEFSVIGGRPQCLNAGDDVGRLHIGDRNCLREHTTVHRALAVGDSTSIGDDNLIMASSHVAHDCVVGNHTIMANYVGLSGHVVVEDHVFLAGMVGVHQRARIGRHAMCGGQSNLKADVPPYVTIDGDSNKVVGVNVVGLGRCSYSRDDIQQIKQAYQVLYRSPLPWEARLAELKAQFPTGPAARFHEFLAESRHGIVQARRAVRPPESRPVPEQVSSLGLLRVA